MNDAQMEAARQIPEFWERWCNNCKTGTAKDEVLPGAKCQACGKRMVYLDGAILEWYWLQFNDPSLVLQLADTPVDRFLGAAAIRAASFGHAIYKAHNLGINPGGAVTAALIKDVSLIPNDARHRLLKQEEIDEIARNNNAKEAAREVE